MFSLYKVHKLMIGIHYNSLYWGLQCVFLFLCVSISKHSWCAPLKKRDLMGHVMPGYLSNIKLRMSIPEKKNILLNQENDQLFHLLLRKLINKWRHIFPYLISLRSWPVVILNEHDQLKHYLKGICFIADLMEFLLKNGCIGDLS